MDEVVVRGQLGALGALLGVGGQARVYRAPGLTLADAVGQLVYKEYKPEHRPRKAGLLSLVAVRGGLDQAERARLDRFAAWPLRVVEQGGEVLGVVLPLIPPRYFQGRVLPGTGAREENPREIQNLLIPPERARMVGMPVPTPVERLALCRQLAAAVHFVHRHDLVIGDLNAKNALFCVQQDVSVMLVDCDAIRRKGTVASRPQMNAPDWDPPERPLSQATDRYKFGLFVLRCLGSGEQISTTRDPQRADGALDSEGRALLRASLSTTPDQRPSVQRWGTYLHERLTGQRAPLAGPSVAPAAAAARIPVSRQPSISTTPGWTRDPVSGRWVERSR